MRAATVLLALAAQAAAQTPPDLDTSHTATCRPGWAQWYQITTPAPTVTARNWPSFSVSLFYDHPSSVFSIFMWQDEFLVMATTGLLHFVEGDITLFPETTYDIWVSCLRRSTYRIGFDTAGDPEFSYGNEVRESTGASAVTFIPAAELTNRTRGEQVGRYIEKLTR